MELKDRMATIIDYANLTASTFARKIGVKTTQAIYDLLAGKTRTVSPKMLNKISSCYPEISITWLMTGKGQMLTSSPDRTINEITEGGMATQGDLSPIYKDVKIEIDDIESEKAPLDVNKSIKEIRQLRNLLSKSEKEIARLEGRIAEQDKFIKMLIDRK